MEAVSYYAIQASCDLADERGSYETFQGSLWSKGVLPLDSQQILIAQRGEKYIDVDLNESLDWAPVRARVQKGIRNSRSEERRVGKECVSTCRSRGSRDH